jgi:hypothetical protein
VTLIALLTLEGVALNMGGVEMEPLTAVPAVSLVVVQSRHPRLLVLRQALLPLLVLMDVVAQRSAALLVIQLDHMADAAPSMGIAVRLLPIVFLRTDANLAAPSQVPRAPLARPRRVQPHAQTVDAELVLGVPHVTLLVLTADVARNMATVDLRLGIVSYRMGAKMDARL